MEPIWGEADELAAADEDELLLLLPAEVADAAEVASIVKSGEMLRVEPIVSR